MSGQSEASARKRSRRNLPAVSVSLTRAEAAALLNAKPSMGWGVRLSVPVQSGYFKLRQAIITALEGDDEVADEQRVER